MAEGFSISSLLSGESLDIEPVREDESWRIIVRVGPDALKERLSLGLHRSTPVASPQVITSEADPKSALEALQSAIQ